MSTVIEGAHVVTSDADRTEFASGHVVLDGNRIIAVGDGPAAWGWAAATSVLWGVAYALWRARPSSRLAPG